MSVRASVVIATYDKHFALPNTLAALAEELSDQIEVIVIDDASPQDPKEIVEKILNDIGASYTYKRLEKRLGSRVSRGLGLELASSESEIIVTLAADVMPISCGMLRELIEHVEPGTVSLCEVKSVPVPADVFEYLSFYKERTLENWDMYPAGRRIFQGSSRPDGMCFLFFAAARKEDLLRLEYDKLSCDLYFHHKMLEHNVKKIYLDDLKAVHQMHPFVQHPCSEIGVCKFTAGCRARGVEKL